MSDPAVLAARREQLWERQTALLEQEKGLLRGIHAALKERDSCPDTRRRRGSPSRNPRQWDTVDGVLLAVAGSL